jgi:hypothetical protein
MSITNEQLALLEYVRHPKDGQDVIQLAAEALISLEPNLASKGDQVMAILIMVHGGTGRAR